MFLFLFCFLGGFSCFRMGFLLTTLQTCLVYHSISCLSEQETRLIFTHFCLRTAERIKTETASVWEGGRGDTKEEVYLWEHSRYQSLKGYQKKLEEEVFRAWLFHHILFWSCSRTFERAQTTTESHTQVFKTYTYIPGTLLCFYTEMSKKL